MNLVDLANQRQQSPESLLKCSIAHYIGMHTKYVSEEYIQKMANSLCNFVIDATKKFEKGQQEHGGSLESRDLINEIHNETIDTFWYNQAQIWKKSLK